ncbi:MAG: hypothetical protein HY663_06410 [Chloroflexi bacterium]|nr:hypothetical protein [Chloroflexota bacterium]
MADDIAIKNSGMDLVVTVNMAAGNTAGAAWRMQLNGTSMGYGLLVAIAVPAAAPKLRLGVRVMWIVTATLVAFSVHAVGLWILAQQTYALAQGHGSKEALANLGITLSYAFLFIPSLVWFPILLRQSRDSAKLLSRRK